MIDNLKDVLQKLMAERYDTEFTQVMDLLQKSYNKGYEDGKAQGYVRGLAEGEESAKASIVAMIKGEIK